MASTVMSLLPRCNSMGTAVGDADGEKGGAGLNDPDEVRPGDLRRLNAAAGLDWIRENGEPRVSKARKLARSATSDGMSTSRFPLSRSVSCHSSLRPKPREKAIPELNAAVCVHDGLVYGGGPAARDPSECRLLGTPARRPCKVVVCHLVRQRSSPSVPMPRFKKRIIIVVLVVVVARDLGGRSET